MIPITDEEANFLSQRSNCGRNPVLHQPGEIPADTSLISGATPRGAVSATDFC